MAKKPGDKLIPPHDLEAEKSVLGALLIDRESIVKVIEILQPKQFYKDAHNKIYRAILDLYEKREPADLITIPAELKRHGELEKVGGVSYLSELVSSVPTVAHIETYAKLIKETFIKRSLINIASDINEMVFNESDVDELLDRSEQLLYSVSQDTLYQDFVPIKDVLEITFERLDEISKRRGQLRGVPTGFKSIDRMMSGLQKENLIILAARPSVGKSSFAVNMAQFAALSEKKSGIIIFSLEMSREMIVDRMISAQAGIDNWKIATGNLDQEDFEKYGIAAGELAEAPVYIDDTPGMGVLEMRAKARRLMLERPIDLIIVDYLQLMKAPSAENRVQEVSKISQGLKNLARELSVPVLALSQLSRGVEQRGGDKRPQLSDLRDSGSIEQDADVVIFLYRPNEEDRNNLKLNIAKHRNGPTGEVDLFFKGEHTRFFEVETHE